ncbi:MAG TPA: 5'-nucleotidase [Burkholderiales bacterium]|nr:5'-nucleotidase [Burkholderiales bacterium]
MIRNSRPSDAYGDLYNALPFRNTIVVMDLSGGQIRYLLEQQWSAVRDEVNILQVSHGFSYAWDASRPIGSRIVPDSIKLDGARVDPGRIYRVAVNNYMADGGDGLTTLKTGRNRVVGPFALDAVAEYLRSHPDLRLPAGGRISRIN